MKCLGRIHSLLHCVHAVVYVPVTLGVHPSVTPYYRKVNRVLACLKMSLSVLQTW